MPRKMPDIVRRDPTKEEKDSVQITRAWLEARCYRDARTGCLVWKKFISKGKQPHTRITIAPKVSATMLVRRLAAKLQLMTGYKRLSLAAANAALDGMQVNCKDHECVAGCVEPKHMVIRTKIEAMRNVRGKPISLSHRMNISAGRRKGSRISDEQIIQMLTDPRPGNKVAEEYGVHPTYVPHVRTGKLRAYSTLGGGMFSGLLAPAHGAFHDEEETA